MDVRVLLAEEQSLFRESIRMALEAEPDIRVVAVADSGVRAVGEVELHHGRIGRDPARIDPFLERVFHAWIVHSTRRFGELVSEPSFRRWGEVRIFHLEEDGFLDMLGSWDLADDGDASEARARDSNHMASLLHGTHDAGGGRCSTATPSIHGPEPRSGHPCASPSR